MTLSAKSSLILPKNKAAFRREGHILCAIMIFIMRNYIEQVSRRVIYDGKKKKFFFFFDYHIFFLITPTGKSEEHRAAKSRQRYFKPHQYHFKTKFLHVKSIKLVRQDIKLYKTVILSLK